MKTFRRCISLLLLLFLTTNSTTLRGKPNRQRVESNFIQTQTYNKPSLTDITKTLSSTMSTMLNTGKAVSSKLLSEAHHIETFQSHKHHKEIHLKLKTIRSELNTTKEKLQKVIQHRDSLQVKLNQMRAKHNSTVQQLTHNLTTQVERFDNLSIAANLTVDPINGSVVTIPNVTIPIPAPHKLVNRSDCEAPCPCDDLGFSLCECCGSSFPTAIEAKQQAENTEHLVTTTSVGLRSMKHKAEKLEKQCKSETSTVKDATHHLKMLQTALKEAQQSLLEYQRINKSNNANFHGSKRGMASSDIQSYIKSSKHQVLIVDIKMNETQQKLNVATTVAHGTCKQWKTAHQEFSSAILLTRNAKVNQVRTELNAQLDSEKRNVQHQKEAKILATKSMNRFNLTMLPLLHTMTSNIQEEALNGVIPASIFGLMETSKDIQKGNMLDILNGDCIVFDPHQKVNISILDLFLKNVQESTLEIQNSIHSLDQSIAKKSANEQSSRQQRASLHHLRTVMSGNVVRTNCKDWCGPRIFQKGLDSTCAFIKCSGCDQCTGAHVSSSGLMDIARNMSDIAHQYQEGRLKDHELEQMAELKHTPFVEEPVPVVDVEDEKDEDEDQKPTTKINNQTSSTTNTSTKPTKPSTITIKLNMPDVKASNFEQDANIEEIDAIAGIKYEEKVPLQTKTNKTNSSIPLAVPSAPENIDVNATKKEKQIQTEAQKILYSTPPLLIGQTWSKLRKQGQADTSLLKGVLDTVNHALKSTKINLDVAVHDYCDALNHHVLLDLENNFIKEQFHNGALQKGRSNQSAPVMASKPVSALRQIVTDILLHSRNGTNGSTNHFQTLKTEMNSNSNSSSSKKTTDSIFYMLVPTAMSSNKEPLTDNNVSTLISAKNDAMSTARGYVAHYYREIRRLETKTLMLMKAKENGWQTYSEEILLQHMHLNKRHVPTTTDLVSASITTASIAMDDLANALSEKMQATLADRTDDPQQSRLVQEANQKYIRAKHQASITEAKVIQNKQKVRTQLSTFVRSKIFTCAEKTQKRFTKVIHARVALAHSRAMAAARRAAEARARLLRPKRNATFNNTTKNSTKKIKQETIETVRETLVRLLRVALVDVMHATNVTSRKAASERADELQIRLSEMDELVNARERVSNATATRASAGSKGNETAIEAADYQIEKALQHLSAVILKQRLRKNPIKPVHDPLEMMFMNKCMGNHTTLQLQNATRDMVTNTTVVSLHKLVVAKNNNKLQKRICRLKLQIKTQMNVLKKTTDAEDRTDIKNEIKILAHKISLLTRTNIETSKIIL